jgi:hypothetical protein
LAKIDFYEIIDNRVDYYRPLSCEGSLSLFCPHCSIKVKPEILFSCAEFYSECDAGQAYVLAYCPDCGERFFILYDLALDYADSYQDNIDPEQKLFIGRHSTFPISEQYAPAYIDRISKDFIRIYGEALHAEKAGLKDVCGAGYRRAVEFLIRDYLIGKEPDQAAVIKKLTFADCAKKFEDHIKNVVEGISRLAADFVHYTRRYEDYSLEDLKEFISILVLMIQNEIVKKEAEAKVAKLKASRA